jgi:hypothetical protein
MYPTRDVFGVTVVITGGRTNVIGADSAVPPILRTRICVVAPISPAGTCIAICVAVLLPVTVAATVFVAINSTDVIYCKCSPVSVTVAPVVVTAGVTEAIIG